MKIILFFLTPIRFLLSSNKKNKKITLCIESGIKGWELRDKIEMYRSAVEYLSDDAVKRVVIDRSDNYIKQLYHQILKHQPTHYNYCPRTGSQDFLTGMYQAVIVCLLLWWYRITPIVWLADVQYKLMRVQSSVVTCLSGIVGVPVAVKHMHGIFPHKRIVGPILYPFFSIKTLNDYLKTLNDREFKYDVSFQGIMYEPRATLLRNIQKKVASKGFNMQIIGRNYITDEKERFIGPKRSSNKEYMSTMINSKIVINTDMQNSETNSMDHMWIKHPNGRFLEVLSAGSMLLSPYVDGIEKYLVPGTHFVPYNTEEDAFNKIIYYLNNEIERARIAEEGHKKMISLIESKMWWCVFDSALGRNSLI